MVKPRRNRVEPASRNGPRHKVRIVGGDWRGRVIEVLDQAALRPTPNRVRETLFNWLGPSVMGARCLDLFAGSGALGLEALSRGAAECLFIEADHATAQQLERLIDRLDAAARGRVLTGDARVPPPSNAPWDIVFIDPPYSAAWVCSVLKYLQQPGLLSATADIYVETDIDDPVLNNPPPGLQCWRDKRASGVRYALLHQQAQ